jgi:hypothetical protein
LNALLFLAGCLATLAANWCAFASFATNDYRPTLAAGFAFALLAVGCFGLLIARRPQGRAFYLVAGILPSLVAMGELVARIASGLLR